jgi:polyisoprenoid-binding protein YceI
MKRIFASAFLAASFIVSAPIIAQQANSNAAQVQAGQYALDRSHTLVRFTVDHFGISEFFGTLPGATGTLSLDPKAISATKLDVTVPVATVSTTNKTLDEELAGAEWLDAAKYPMMRFVSTKVVKTGANAADVTGNLTLHGVTRPVTLKATFKAAAVNPMRPASSSAPSSASASTPPSSATRRLCPSPPLSRSSRPSDPREARCASLLPQGTNKNPRRSGGGFLFQLVSRFRRVRSPPPLPRRRRCTGWRRPS